MVHSITYMSIAIFLFTAACVFFFCKKVDTCGIWALGFDIRYSIWVRFNIFSCIFLGRNMRFYGSNSGWDVTIR